MNKICTSIEQSKRLIELGIDVNTADMFYLRADIALGEIECYPNVLHREEVGDDIPAWSLSAVLKILPSEFAVEGEFGTCTYKIHIRKRKLIDDVDVYQIAYGNYKFYEDGSSSWRDMINTSEEEDLIDAAFEMIVWLKENGRI